MILYDRYGQQESTKKGYFSSGQFQDRYRGYFELNAARLSRVRAHAFAAPPPRGRVTSRLVVHFADSYVGIHYAHPYAAGVLVHCIRRYEQLLPLKM